MHLIDTLALLGVALILAKILGGLANRFGIPAVLAELGTGILLGNAGGAFLTLENSEVLKSLSELGVLFLLLVVGLETELREIAKVGKQATIAAFIGVITPFVLAFLFVPMITQSNLNHTLFMAAALTATSVGITARVLQDTGKLSSKSGQIILGAAVIDDVLGIIVLTIISALVTQGAVSGTELGILLGKIFLFGVGVAVVRRFVLPQAIMRIRPLEVSGTLTAFLFSMTLIAAWSAEKMGLAGIIGAFSLGVALDEVYFEGYKEYHKRENFKLEELLKPIGDFLIPIFFIAMGMGVKIKTLMNPDALIVASVLILLAVIGKLACGFAISKNSKKEGADRLLVGFGMIPRGEVGLIFAAMGLKLSVLNQADYAAVVIMVAVTTLIAPGLIAWRSKRV